MKGNEVLIKPDDPTIQASLEKLLDELKDELDILLLSSQPVPAQILYRIRMLEPIVKESGAVVSADVWKVLKKELKKSPDAKIFGRSWEVIASFVHTGRHPGKPPARVPRPKDPLHGSSAA